MGPRFHGGTTRMDEAMPCPAAVIPAEAGIQGRFRERLKKTETRATAFAGATVSARPAPYPATSPAASSMAP